MMNLQELQTINEYKLPIKLFIFNNDGYLMIKHTQKIFLKEDIHPLTNEQVLVFQILRYWLKLSILTILKLNIGVIIKNL